MAPTDYFFAKIGSQLIHTPQESRTLLERAARRTWTPPDIPGASVAIGMAQAWVRNIIRPEYQPPPGTVFVPFQRESGICDVVRTAYHAQGLAFEIAQSFSMFNVTVKDGATKGSNTETVHAAKLAKSILNTDTPMDFQNIGSENGFLYGKQRTTCEPFNCDWSELLRWWQDSRDIGFITLKTTKSPERAVVGVGEEDNTVWFGLYKRK